MALSGWRSRGGALGVAHATHQAFGRHQAAGAALAVARAAGLDQLWQPASREEIRYFPTFAEALDQLGARAELRSALTMPAAAEDMDATLFATGQRGHPETNPARGLVLAGLATRRFDDQPLAAFRVAAETHVLLVHSQQHAPGAVDAMSAAVRPAWAEMLRRCSQWVAEEHREGAMALDVADHMARVVLDMADDARADRGDCAAVTARCDAWHHHLRGS